ncbi:MAG: hypothetical protein GWP03_06870 [Proteobacteria bacterium]|nr:hypothetical protein [Pseudomonadota bacterium]
MKKLAFIILLLPLLSLSAAKRDIPFEINYYGISPGAEALSMGYAFSGYGISPASVFWNPANISLMKFSSLYMDFAKYDSVDITDLIDYQNGLKGTILFPSYQKRGAFHGILSAYRMLKTVLLPIRTVLLSSKEPLTSMKSY